ncbi:hypothetical protein VP01_4340g1 [Puccinia sorghi]|uniref:Uncharacterized protein n=1 Tax=Puccinia sorghi TaxID=27349 RepID=A0A0L6UPW3_9BASI|nr:hypothetical protein VP01_4340g1 [Puccinia sorghi]
MMKDVEMEERLSLLNVGEKGIWKQMLQPRIELRSFGLVGRPLLSGLCSGGLQPRLPAVDMQYAPAKLPSKLQMSVYVDFLAQSLCIKAWLNQVWRMVGVTTEASWDFLHVNCRQLSNSHKYCQLVHQLTYYYGCSTAVTLNCNVCWPANKHQVHSLKSRPCYSHPNQSKSPKAQLQKILPSSNGQQTCGCYVSSCKKTQKLKQGLTKYVPHDFKELLNLANPALAWKAQPNPMLLWRGIKIFCDCLYQLMLVYSEKSTEKSYLYSRLLTEEYTKVWRLEMIPQLQKPLVSPRGGLQDHNRVLIRWFGNVISSSQPLKGREIQITHLILTAETFREFSRDYLRSAPGKAGRTSDEMVSFSGVFIGAMRKPRKCLGPSRGAKCSFRCSYITNRLMLSLISMWHVFNYSKHMGFVSICYEYFQHSFLLLFNIGGLLTYVKIFHVTSESLGADMYILMTSEALRTLYKWFILCYQVILCFPKSFDLASFFLFTTAFHGTFMQYITSQVEHRMKLGHCKKKTCSPADDIQHASAKLPSKLHPPEQINKHLTTGEMRLLN